MSILCWLGFHKWKEIRDPEKWESGMYKGSYSLTFFLGCARCPRKTTEKVYFWTEEAKSKHCWDGNFPQFCSGPGLCACRCEFCKEWL